MCLFVGLLSSTAAPLDFARDIRPLLSDACYNCHGPDAKARKAGLRLDDRAAAHDSGVLTNGEMLRRLTTTEPDERMPPLESNRTLTDEQRAKLAQWLRAGAAWPSDDRHWAFVPPKRPPLAKVNDSAWPRNGIDHFILARLESEQLAPSSEADKATLLRRVSFDLTGLPPTVEALDAFLADTSSDAYERAIDRLLDSPRYGEHMALGWLEASRYADTDGYQNDRLRYMWVWRDWVIQAFNDNMPFDRFVTEQMAGGGVRGGITHGETNDYSATSLRSRCTSMICRPPSCTSSASTTNASPSVIRAATIGSQTSTAKWCTTC